MQRDFKIKNKLSFSPNRTSENVFTMRARISKKTSHINHKLALNSNSENYRHFSQSARKPKNMGHKLFSGAHKINSKETYLPNEKVHRQSKTKQLSNPMSPSNGEFNSIKGSFGYKKLQSRSISKMASIGKGIKDIQRTVSIAIRGKKEDLPSHDELMTTLTNIILGGDRSQDDFYLEIVGQSSIHGDQQNFILLDSHIFKENGLALNTDIHKE